MTDNTVPRKGTIKTYTGIYVDPLDMRPEDIRVVDMAHSLANSGRYNGHYPVLRSIAAHCIDGCEYILQYWPDERDEALAFLLHDGEEAYTGDMVNPMKRQPVMKPFVVAGECIQQVIAKKYGLAFPHSARVHEVDQWNGEYERLCWQEGTGIATIKENPADVEARFIELFLELGGVDEHLESIR
jgi:hypothetical protein